MAWGQIYTRLSELLNRSIRRFMLSDKYLASDAIFCELAL